VNAPDGLLPGNPYFQARLDEFQSLHLVVQLEATQRVNPWPVILGSEEKSVHGDGGQVIANKRMESLKVQMSPEK